MERRYLVATLALAATFMVFSQAFGAGRLAKLPRSRAEVQADIACVRRTVAERIMAKLAPYVDSRAPEQAQMVAELNLPQLAQVEQQVDDAQRLSGTGRTPEVPGSDAGAAGSAAGLPDADPIGDVRSSLATSAQRTRSGAGMARHGGCSANCRSKLSRLSVPSRFRREPWSVPSVP